MHIPQLHWDTKEDVDYVAFFESMVSNEEDPGFVARAILVAKAKKWQLKKTLGAVKEKQNVRKDEKEPNKIHTLVKSKDLVLQSPLREGEKECGKQPQTKWRIAVREEKRQVLSTIVPEAVVKI